MTRKLITFDIDGTLAQAPAMSSGDWSKLAVDPHAEQLYYASLELADPHLPGFFTHLHEHGFDIGIITARSMRVKQTIYDWFAAKKLNHIEWLVSNMGGAERVPFLRSIQPLMHLDDHPEALRYRFTQPLWYNTWPKELAIKYNTWPEIYDKFAYYPTPAPAPVTSGQMLLF